MFLSAGELCHVLMGRSAASKLRRKSQREASELRDQTYNRVFQDTLAMEEEELAREDGEEEDEVVFKRRKTVSGHSSGVSRQHARSGRERGGPPAVRQSATAG